MPEKIGIRTKSDAESENDSPGADLDFATQALNFCCYQSDTIKALHECKTGLDVLEIIGQTIQRPIVILTQLEH